MFITARGLRSSWPTTEAPTATPSPSFPTGLSYLPSPKPTPTPSTTPTAVPTVVGAVTSGYIVQTSYSDPKTCSSVVSMTLYRLGACIVGAPTLSWKYLSFDANYFASTGTVRVEFFYFSDGNCGAVSYRNSEYPLGNSNCSYTFRALYSASLQMPSAPGVITA